MTKKQGKSGQVAVKALLSEEEDYLQRLNQELERRTRVVRIFPNTDSRLRLIRAMAVEIHENWLEATRYLNMAHLIEHKKEKLRQLDEAEAA